MKKTLAQEMIEGAHELADALERGQTQKFNVRTVARGIKAPRFTPAMVKKTRKLLNASQPIFARFLGVAPATVKAWEHGDNVPSGMAARFLDEIRSSPDYWRSRFLRYVTAAPPSRAAKRIVN